MNIVRELRKKSGMQQKELALTVGVAQPTVSEWESNKKDPSGDRLKKLSEIFGVDELVILGKGVVDICEQQSEYPKTIEAKIISAGVDRMPPESRKVALNLLNTVFAEFFENVEDKIS